MVRRFRRVRQRAPRRPRSTLGWAGPPPLLLLATVAALAALPFLGDGSAASGALAPTAATTSPRSVEPHVVGPQRLEVSRGGVTRTAAPVELKQVRLGVATANMFKRLTPDQALADALRITRDPGVDVVGWQEAEDFTDVLHRLPGWRTKTFRDVTGPSELAVSWRRDEFRLVSARQLRMTTGVGWEDGLYPFPSRRAAVVTLQHRDTGRLLTVLDTHLPQAIEDLARPGYWAPTINAGRAREQLRRIASLWNKIGDHWLVGTGDFNFDARADAAHRPAGGPRAALGPTAVSSYMALGTQVTPTFPENGRYIDYVWIDRRAQKAGTASFAGQRVISGLNSDHNVLVGRIVLS